MIQIMSYLYSYPLVNLYFRIKPKYLQWPQDHQGLSTSPYLSNSMSYSSPVLNNLNTSTSSPSLGSTSESLYSVFLCQECPPFKCLSNLPSGLFLKIIFSPALLDFCSNYSNPSFFVFLSRYNILKVYFSVRIPYFTCNKSST